MFRRRIARQIVHGREQPPDEHWCARQVRPSTSNRTLAAAHLTDDGVRLQARIPHLAGGLDHIADRKIGEVDG
jgi:hypothetical protein